MNFSKKNSLKKKIGAIFLLFGIILFLLFLYKFGTEALHIIKLNLNFYYLAIFIAIVLISFIPYVMRFKVIVDSYGKKVSLTRLIKQTIAAFAISYVTPASRLGGEPVRIYMLKKECDIDYVTSTSSVILDKFVELSGSALYGIIGFILLINLFGVPLYFKLIFGSAVLLALVLLYLIYHKSKNNKNIFSAIIKISRLDKFDKIKNSVSEIDNKIGDFFRNKKKVLLMSFMYYIISGVFFLIQFKFLLLSIGIDASLGELILIINVWGILNFIPTPASLGFLEAGQSGLFYLIQGSSAEGLAMTLLLRVGYLMVVSIGFFFLSQFGLKQFFTKTYKS